MRDSARGYRRAVAIDPTSRGFGFAVLEYGNRLVDWGNKQVPPEHRNARSARAVLELTRTYDPDVLVLERCADSSSRRCRRVRLLIQTLWKAARADALCVESVSPRDVKRVCAGDVHATKADVATALATRFPEIARHVPPPRKPWMSESDKIAMFEAVGMAVVAMDRRNRSAPDSPNS